MRLTSIYILSFLILTLIVHTQLTQNTLLRFLPSHGIVFYFKPKINIILKHAQILNHTIYKLKLFLFTPTPFTLILTTIISFSSTIPTKYIGSKIHLLKIPYFDFSQFLFTLRCTRPPQSQSGSIFCHLNHHCVVFKSAR